MKGGFLNLKERIMLNKREENITLKEGFEKFLIVKKAMNLSEASIKGYKGSFRYFTDFIGEETICSCITDDSFYSFIEYLREKNSNITNTSINTYLRNLRAIFYFFMEKGFLPKYDIKLIKSEKKIKETYNDEELGRLLIKPDLNTCQFSEYRNWVIVSYLLGTGNRLNTLCNIKIGDVDLLNGNITLRQVKNKKAYILPLSATLNKILAEYIQLREGNDEDYLFCNTFGEQLCKNALTTAIERYNKRRGVEKTSIHLFRHTFAKSWILNGGDIFRLQKILGHSSIEIVKEYVNMFGNDLKYNFDEFNPLEKVAGLNTEKQYIKIKNKKN